MLHLWNILREGLHKLESVQTLLQEVTAILVGQDCLKARDGTVK